MMAQVLLCKGRFPFNPHNMVMDGYYVQDRLQALWQKIESLHLSYLQMEDSPQKLEQRARLEDCIKEYLCQAPHNQKFCFHETAQVLHRSASCKKDFSGYKAATGWNAIQMYAGNLLGQPWRKEYRQINMYSGFYIHNIEANLVGAEIMFEVMGYKHEGDSVLVLEGPICPDRVTNVSRDALMAYVECQILKAIWEEVSSNVPITWLDVLEFRETHFCNPKQSITALNYLYHQKQFQEQQQHQQQQTTHSNNNSSDLMLQPPRHHHINHNHSFPPLHNTTPTPHIMPAPQYIYGYATYAPVTSHYSYPLPMAYQQPTTLKTPHYGVTNGFCCSQGEFPPSNYVCAVPTGQLIELEGGGGGGCDRVDGKRLNSEVYAQKNCGVTRVEGLEGGKEEGGGLENWDYVYRNLESQGYSKDLGERGDILTSVEQGGEKNNHQGHAHQRRKVKPTNLDEVLLNNLTVSDRPLKINEALERYKETDQKNKAAEVVKKVTAATAKTTTPSSSYENLSHTKPSKSVANAPITAKTKVAAAAAATTVKKGGKTNNSVEGAAVVGGVDTRWQCGYCTYLNEGGRVICEMCSKSKVVVEQRMEIGGAQCPQCTLVNPRESVRCQACDASLKDSPTYI